MVDLNDESLLGIFLGQTFGWFQSLVRDEKPVWPKAAGLTNIIPGSVSILSAVQFVESCCHGPFGVADAGKLLVTSIFSPPP